MDCACPGEWYRCKCDGEQTVYDAAGHPWEVEDIGVPTPEFVAYVRKLHPTARLVYIDLPHLDYGAKS